MSDLLLFSACRLTSLGVGQEQLLFFENENFENEN